MLGFLDVWRPLTSFRMESRQGTCYTDSAVGLLGAVKSGRPAIALAEIFEMAEIILIVGELLRQQ